MKDFNCWMHEMSFNFRNREYVCDCLDFNFIALARHLKNSKFLDGVVCTNMQILQYTRVSEVPLEELVCDVQDNCPLKCRCVSQPSNLTFHVICTNSSLNTFQQ